MLENSGSRVRCPHFKYTNNETEKGSLQKYRLNLNNVIVGLYMAHVHSTHGLLQVYAYIMYVNVYIHLLTLHSNCLCMSRLITYLF